jgi:MFS family permease
MMLFMTLPVIVFGPIAGVLIDRWNKQKVMVVCDSLRMVCAALIPVVFLLTRNIYPVFVIVFFMFLLALFFNTARNAIIPNLISKKRILNANSVLNFIGRGATFLGMVSGGIIIDWGFWNTALRIQGWVVAFIIDALSFLISAIMLYIMRIRLIMPERVEAHLEARGVYLMIRSGLVKMFHEMKEAVHSIIREKKIAFAIAALFLVVLIASLVWTLGIPMIQQERGWGMRGISIVAATGAIGLLLGAYLIGVIGHRYDLRVVVLFSFILISACMIVFPFINRLWVFALITLICGTVISPIFIGSDTLIHQYADEFIRGRIFSLREWVYCSTMPVGCFFFTSIKIFANKNLIFALFGAAVALLCVIGWFFITNGQGPSVPPDRS